MPTITVKGHEIVAPTFKDSYNRRAVQLKNNIIASLRRLGIREDDIDIDLEPNAMRKAPALVTWYLDRQNLQYLHNSMSKYVENLYIAFKVIDLEVTALIEEKKTFEEFIFEFSEDDDVADQRKDARSVLGLDDTVTDIKIIDKAYRDLARKYHPDMDTGDIEKFKEINRAHKLIKRELM